MKNLIFNHPIYPIPPSFINSELDLESTSKYLNYIKKSGGKTIMSTAGTSQFNLLSLKEVRKLNKKIGSFSGNKILGIPELSLKDTLNEIRKLNDQFLENTSLLIIFPERYYSNNQVLKYFEQISDVSSYNILLHANPIKKGSGGVFDYDNKILHQLSNIDKFIGIKEESLSIDHSINNLNSLNLEVIVAGGSMRRYWALEPHGATTFLTGLGSLFPSFSEDFFNAYQNNKIEQAKIILEIERKLFSVFMKIGWHASMRYALKIMTFIKDNREPFIDLNETYKEEIKHIINKIKLCQNHI